MSSFPDGMWEWFDKIRPKVSFDIGGYKGSLAKQAVNLGSITHCFEPCRESYNLILSRYQDDIDNGRLFVHNAGVAEYKGKRKFYYRKSKPISQDNTMDYGLSKEYHEERICNVVSILDIMKEYKCTPNFIKLNAEGAEYDVFKSFDVWRDSLQLIFVSWHLGPKYQDELSEDFILHDEKSEDFINQLWVRKTHVR